MQDRLEQLMQGMNISLIVLIDDDFISEGFRKEKILSEILLLNKKDLKLFLERLKEKLSDSLFERLMSVIEKLQNLTTDKDHSKWEAALKSKRIFNFFKKDEDFLNKIESILDDLKQEFDSHSGIGDLFFVFGIGIKKDILSYKKIVTDSSQRSLRFYKDAPDSAELIEEIDSKLEPTEFCMCIVDKFLNHALTDGAQYLERLLPKFKNKNIISIIYTSMPQEKNNDVKQQNDYFLVEIKKGEEDSLKLLTDGLALCAFSTLFDKLTELQMDSLNKAKLKAFSRKANILHLASMSHEEGVTPYETIFSWLNLAVSHENEKTLIKKGIDEKSLYSFMMGLTQFLEAGYLDKSLELEEGWNNSEEDVNNLNTFEIFDYNVNEFHKPSAPGDVFLMPDGSYSILVGQDCEFIVRGASIQRKAKYADLLSAEFLPKRNEDKIKKNNNSIELNYYKEVKNEISRLGVLKVSFSSKKNGDFELFDLCTYNKDGISKVLLQEDLSEEIYKLVPRSWKSYYPKIQNKIRDCLKYYELCKEAGITLENFSSNNDISIIDLTKDINQKREILFPIKRICRIKNDFLEIILKSYWEERSRIGINTIGMTYIEELSNVTVNLKYPQEEKCSINISNLNCYLEKSNKRSKNQKIESIKVSFNIEGLKELNKRIAEIETSKIIIDKKVFKDKKTGIEFSKIIKDNNLEGIMISIPYRLTSKKKEIIKEHELTIEALLKKERIEYEFDTSKNDITYTLGEDSQEYNLIESSVKKIEIEHFKKGITIKSLNLKFELNEDGEITLNKI